MFSIFDAWRAGSEVIRANMLEDSPYLMHGPPWPGRTRLLRRASVPLGARESQCRGPRSSSKVSETACTALHCPALHCTYLECEGERGVHQEARHDFDHPACERRRRW